MFQKKENKSLNTTALLLNEMSLSDGVKDNIFDENNNVSLENISINMEKII